MNTQLLPISEQSLALASDMLRQGELVAFPTETVYGLGANALNADAVRRIFAAKGRPADNPLIVHIHDRSQLDSLCEIPEASLPLMEAFWPGPLTLLFPRKKTVPDAVTAGLPTVAVRMPSHPAAAALLRVSGVPVAAPSANRSGRPSPTTAAHVMEDLRNRIPLILDGGPCEVGLESTVLDLTHGEPVILRPGGITKDMLEEVLKRPVSVAGSVLRPLRENETALSPGMRYKHYAPQAVLTLVEGDPGKVVSLMRKRCLEDRAAGLHACVLCFREHMDALRECNPHDIGSLSHPAETARLLFDVLRTLDEERMDSVYSEVLPPEGMGLAVMNRLGRAAAFRTLHAD